jgi:hypothetical protein
LLISELAITKPQASTSEASPDKQRERRDASRESELLADLLRRVERIEEHLGIRES